MSAYTIEVNTVFSAAHQLRLPGGGAEPLHGHDWHVTLRIAATVLDGLETVLDFHDVEAALARICDRLRNQNLNRMEPFVTQWNPSAERVAEHIGRGMVEAINGMGVGDRGVKVVEVRVTEAPGCAAIWTP